MSDGRDWHWGEMRTICVRLARQVAKDSNAAEDVAQDALLRAWRYRHNLRESDRRDQWLARIVRNEAARRWQRPQPEPAGELVRATAADDPKLLNASVRLDLQLALEQLNKADRLLLRLRYEEDLTQPAIARLLGLPEGTVKVRLHRAREKLHRAIKDE